MSRHLCKTCPHLRKSEGGEIPDDIIPTTRVYLGGNEQEPSWHPCHSNPARPCEGHIRDDLLLAQGESEDPFTSVSYLLDGQEPKHDFTPFTLSDADRRLLDSIGKGYETPALLD